MATFNEWCLYTTEQVRMDIAPGVSGWNIEAEGWDLRSLLLNAQNSIGVPGEEQVGIRNRVAQQITDELPGSGSQAEKEREASRGEFGAAMLQTNNHFQALVDEDNDE